MTSRVLATGLGVLTLLGLAACGGSDGSGSSTVTTTVTLNAPNYVTAAPIMTATTLAPVVEGADPAAVAGEQSYTVVANDYLLGIAKKFCITLDVLVAYNAWPEGAAHAYYPGDVFKIPAGACDPATATTVASTGTEATTVAASTTTIPDPSAGGTYTVVNGDFLNGIATKLGTTVDAIVAANGWSDGANHSLFPGDVIKVPAKTG